MRTLTQIIADAITYITSVMPGLSTVSGTVARDVVIDSPAQEFALVYNELNRTQLIQSLEFPDQYTADELDRVAADVSLLRSPGTAATVPIVFRLPTLSVDITISAGTQVATQTSSVNPTAINFITTTTGVFSAANAASYYDPLTGLYELTIIAQAVNAGSLGNVAAGSITVLSSTINNATSMTVINLLSATGGTDTESNTSLAARIKTKLAGNNTGTSNGVLSLVKANLAVADTLLIRPGDSELLRNQYGNAFDIVVIGETLVDAEDPFTFSPNQLTLVLRNQPVPNVIEVTGFVSSAPYSFVEGVDYTVLIDATSMFTGTIKAFSSITFLISGTLPDTSSTVTVHYSLNNLIQNLQNTLESDDNKIIGSDPLAKEATKVLVNVGATIRTFPGFTHTDVANSAITNVTNLINARTLNIPVDQSDIIAAIQDTPGVDEVDIPISLEAKRPFDPGFIPVNNVTVKRIEYCRPNTIIIS